MTESQLMTSKQREKPKSVQLRHIAAFSAVAVSVGACLVREHGLESGGPLGNTQPEVEARQAVEKKWAERLELSGVPNLHKVSEDLYRGAQPSAEGMRQLEELGIKTVVNLRFILSDRDKIRGTGLGYEHINMTTWNPKTSDVVRFLQIVTDSNRTPVFVHCERGTDRTGTMCAIYRIAAEGWSRDEAIEEMTKGGFGFHSVRKNLVNYVRGLDIDKIKHKTALTE